MAQTVEPALQRYLSWTGLFRGTSIGLDLLTAGVILAVMTVPTITAVSRDAMASVPAAQREAALSLGATNWETTRMAVLPYSRSGIVGGVMLGLGRALGETMAVVMVIGGADRLPTPLLSQGQTVASLIANELASNNGPLQVLGGPGSRVGAPPHRDRGERGGSVARRPGLPDHGRTGRVGGPTRKEGSRIDHTGRRKVLDHLVTALSAAAIVVVLVPLFNIVYEAFRRGGAVLFEGGFLTDVPPNACSQLSCQTVGIGPDIVGSVPVIGLASAIAVPIGVLAAISPPSTGPAGSGGRFPSSPTF